MVKPDPERDYYKDLGLEQNADITEIKKQYRKLALKLHPDRNQDDVEGATKQFQIIGEAHEVLSDPALKQKYDIARQAKLQLDRQRSRSAYPEASGVRGNPWQNAGDNFPAPPRRTNMPPRGGDRKPQPSHPTARQKYQNMFNGGGGGASTSSRRTTDDSDDTYTAFDTFQKYRQSRRQGAKGTQSSGNNTTNPPPQKPRRGPDTPPRPAPPPRTAAQKEKQDAAFGSRRGRSGYQPDSPAAQDEPPVTRSSYFSTGRHTDLFANATANSRREREEQVEDKSGQSAETMDEDSDSFARRQRRAYASSPGERLDPRAAAGGTGPDLGRARSTREPRKMTETSPSPRQRSASVPNNEERPASDFGQPSIPQPGFNTTSNHSTSSVGGNSKAADTSTPRPTTNPNQASGPTPANVDQASPTQNGNPSVYAPPLKKFKLDCNSAFSTPSAPHLYSATRLSPMEKQQTRILEQIIEARDKARSGANNAGFGPSPSRAATVKKNDCPIKNPKVASKTPSSGPTNPNNLAYSRFSFHMDDEIFKSTSPPKHPFASQSAEDVNTTAFRTSDEGYSFSANTETGNSGATKHRASSGSRAGRRSPLKKSRSGASSEFVGRMYSGGQEKPDEAHAQSPNVSTSRFDPKEWSNKIKPDIFNPPPAHAPSTSPTRGRSGTTKRGKRPVTVEEQADIQNDEGFSSSSSIAEPTSAGSPMDMDIDTPPADKTTHPPTRSTSTARNIPVEPSRPDWRSGDHNGETTNGNKSRVASTAGTPSKPPTSPAATPGSRANPITAGGSEDTDDLKASFSELRHTEPMQQPKPSGLGGWDDVKSSLPFQSRANPNLHGVERPPALKLPNAPDMHAPTPPVLPASLNLNNSNPVASIKTADWMGYMAAFASYLENWTRYERRIIEYLTQAQRELDDHQITGTGYGWLRPESDDAIIKAYDVLSRDEQDVRERWTMAGRTHREALREVRFLRERIRKLGLAENAQPHQQQEHHAYQQYPLAGTQTRV
ncbi:hypothetical protein MKZ38_007206 [Zalerion maritima]|uniref:J domain-containing protein n=1 Tax=Zalerion maritima TaxID=339359 RepID=A0AAD5RIB4_9PEZI|nr:hypothetical protein MKZ38_007206 [Zalerion maritima]